MSCDLLEVPVGSLLSFLLLSLLIVHFQMMYVVSLTSNSSPNLSLLTTHCCKNTRLGGRAWSGRLATPSNAGGTRPPLTLTAISVSVTQRRSVVLWSLCDALPADSAQLIAHPVDGVLVVGANEIIYIDGGGRMRCGVASNGFARATCLYNFVTPLVALSISIALSSPFF